MRITARAAYKAAARTATPNGCSGMLLRSSCIQMRTRAAECLPTPQRCPAVGAQRVVERARRVMSERAACRHERRCCGGSGTARAAESEMARPAWISRPRPWFASVTRARWASPAQEQPALRHPSEPGWRRAIRAREGEGKDRARRGRARTKIYSISLIFIGKGRGEAGRNSARQYPGLATAHLCRNLSVGRRGRSLAPRHVRRAPQRASRRSRAAGRARVDERRRRAGGRRPASRAGGRRRSGSGSSAGLAPRAARPRSAQAATRGARTVAARRRPRRRAPSPRRAPRARPS